MVVVDLGLDPSKVAYETPMKPDWSSLAYDDCMDMKE